LGKRKLLHIKKKKGKKENKDMRIKLRGKKTQFNKTIDAIIFNCVREDMPKLVALESALGFINSLQSNVQYFKEQIEEQIEWVRIKK
jgi:hypothetical protein